MRFTIPKTKISPHENGDDSGFQYEGREQGKLSSKRGVNYSSCKQKDSIDTKVSISHESSEDYQDNDELKKATDLVLEVDPYIPGEPLKLLLALGFLFFGLSASALSLSLTHDRMPDSTSLPDIILSNVPYQHWGVDASEYVIIISIFTAGIVVLFHKHRTIVARRVCLLIGLHYIYRAVTFFITVLPNPGGDQCAPKSNHTTMLLIMQRFVKLSGGFGFSISGHAIYCGDYIYSGHTVTLISCYLIIQEYSPRTWFFLHYTSFFTSTSGVIFLLLGRYHYSVDCVIAYWITTRIWWIFHTLAQTERMKYGNNNVSNNTNQNNYLKRIWWWHIFWYFEKNVPHNLLLEFTWPIPQKLQNLKTSSVQK